MKSEEGGSSHVEPEDENWPASPSVGPRCACNAMHTDLDVAEQPSRGNIGSQYTREYSTVTLLPK
jgi:hypothetical protein